MKKEKLNQAIKLNKRMGEVEHLLERVEEAKRECYKRDDSAHFSLSLGGAAYRIPKKTMEMAIEFEKNRITEIYSDLERQLEEL